MTCTVFYVPILSGINIRNTCATGKSRNDWTGDGLNKKGNGRCKTLGVAAAIRIQFKMLRAKLSSISH